MPHAARSSAAARRPLVRHAAAGRYTIIHAWQSSRGEQLYRALEFSTIARADGVLILISTAGHDQGHFFYDLVTKARNVLKGDDLDTSFFASVHEPDADDDLDEPTTWAKANPSPRMRALKFNTEERQPASIIDGTLTPRGTSRRR